MRQKRFERVVRVTQGVRDGAVEVAGSAVFLLMEWVRSSVMVRNAATQERTKLQKLLPNEKMIKLSETGKELDDDSDNQDDGDQPFDVTSEDLIVVEEDEDEEEEEEDEDDE